MKNFLVTEMNAKIKSIFIFNWATETVMKNLLIQYFTSQNHATLIWTIYLYIDRLCKDLEKKKSVVKKKKTITQSTCKKQNQSKKKIKIEFEILKIYIIFIC